MKPMLSTLSFGFLGHLNVQNSLFSLVIISLLIWYIKYLWTRRKLYINSWNIPGPLAFPFIGTTYKFLRKNSEILDLLDESLSYPGIFKIWIGNKLGCVLFEPRYLEKIFTSPYSLDKPKDYSRLTDVIGEGVFSPTVKQAKPFRKALVPMFYKSALESYVKIFSESSVKFVEILKDLSGRKDVNWEILTTRYLLDTTCKTMLGFNIPITTTEPSEEDIGFCLRKVADISTYRYVRLWYNLKFVYNISQTKKELEKYINLYHNHIVSIVRKRINIQKTKSESTKMEYEGYENKKQNDDYFEYLFNDSGFTEDEVVETVKSVFAAGVDTTSGALCSVLVMLGIFTDVQQKVYEEIIEVVGTHQEIKYSDMHHLQYTERVIKESLRLLPPTTIYGRETSDDLDLGDYTLPKDTNLVVIPLLIHRNPTAWKDPLKFDPDRFLPEENVKRSPYSYVTFSHGSRNCIGWQHALMNLKTVVATIVRDLRVFTEYKSIEDIKLNFELILTLTKGSRLWFEPRK